MLSAFSWICAQEPLQGMFRGPSGCGERTWVSHEQGLLHPLPTSLFLRNPNNSFALDHCLLSLYPGFFPQLSPDLPGPHPASTILVGSNLPTLDPGTFLSPKLPGTKFVSFDKQEQDLFALFLVVGGVGSHPEVLGDLFPALNSGVSPGSSQRDIHMQCWWLNPGGLHEN